jgi:hypothetical protein
MGIIIGAVGEERELKIKEKSIALVRERYIADANEIFNVIKNNSKQAAKEYRQAFENVCEKAYVLQENGIKEEIAYITITYLRSSILTGSYEFMFQLYNQDFYYDAVETSSVWSSLFIMKYYENTVTYLENAVKSQIIQLQEYEFRKIKIDLAGDYYKLVSIFIVEQIQDMLQQECFKKLKKASTLKVLYGGYMDKTIELASVEAEE